VSEPETNPHSAGGAVDDSPPPARTQLWGLRSATAIVIANMIGAGVFTTSGFSLASLDNREHVLLAWLVAGTIALSGAIGYGALSRHITGSGGEYLFLSRAIHPLAGFLAGWISLVVGFTGAIAFAAMAFCDYALADDSFMPPKVIAAGLVLGFGLLHAMVRRGGVLIQDLIVFLKVGVLVIFVLIAIGRSGEWPGLAVQNPPSSAFAPWAFAATLVWISLSYSGFNAAVYIAGEVRNPQQTVPRALLLGTAITTVFYVVLNAVFVYAPEPQVIAGNPEVALFAAPVIAGEWFATIVRLVICLALLSSVSSMIIAGPRVYAKMADDGVLPPALRFRNGNASFAILVQSVLAVIFILFTGLKDLLTYLSLVLSVSAALTVSCLFSPSLRRQGRTRGWERVAAGFFVMATLFLAGMSVVYHVGQARESGTWPRQLLAAGGTIVAGVICYYLARRGSGIGGESQLEA